MALLLALAAHQALAQGGTAPPGTRNGTAAAAPSTGAPTPSADAQRAYSATRDRLLQIRTLIRNTDTQTSVGSGFRVSGDGLIVTNFHVAARLALEPERHRAVAVGVDGGQVELDLLAFDVQNDLAVLRPRQAVRDAPALVFRSEAEPLARGERIYSLGNPLDIGFAVTEGTYNGLVQRSFPPRIFFGGALNPGMSGGPAIDAAGRVVGVNVAKRMDGEMVSFLVPARFAAALVARAGQARPVAGPAHAEIGRQLLAHQEELARRFTGTPLKAQRHGGYVVPVPEDSLARCWGRGRDPDSKGFDVERTDCRIDSQVFAGEFNTGFVRLRHEAYDAPRFSALRFARRYSQSFRNERFNTRTSRHRSSADCHERYIDRDGMPMRAVLCVNGYRKFPGLYDVALLVTTLNQPRQGVQGRLDISGVSFDNGMKLVDHYLAGFRWEARP